MGRIVRFSNRPSLLPTAPRPFLTGTSRFLSVRIVAPDSLDRLLPRQQQIELDVRLAGPADVGLGLFRERPERRLDLDVHGARKPRTEEDAPLDLEGRLSRPGAAHLEGGLLHLR